MSMSAYLLNELRLSLYRQRRYFFEFTLSWLFLLLVFGAMAWGVRVIPNAEELLLPLDVLAVGFVVWGFANAAYSSISNELSDEMRSRTLEQLFLAAVPLWQVLLRRAVIHLASALLSTLVLFHVCLYIAGRPVMVDVGGTLLILVMAAPSLVGLGYLIGGINIVFKQVDTVNAMMVFFFMFLVSVPAYPLGGFSMLPFSYAASLLVASKAMAQPTPLDVLVILGNSAVYFVAGLAVFMRCKAVAVARGTLNHV